MEIFQKKLMECQGGIILWCITVLDFWKDLKVFKYFFCTYTLDIAVIMHFRDNLDRHLQTAQNIIFTQLGLKS